MGRKQIKFDVINPADKPQSYKLFEDVRAKYHEDTKEARVALAWKLDTKPDADNHIELGKCIMVTDLMKEWVDFDFIILLNKEMWNDEKFDEPKKRALLDHEMSHIAPVYDADGKKRDSRNRLVWRMRDHDIQEFTSVVERHGTYKRDLEDFARALLKVRGTPLFPDDNPPAETVTIQ